MNDNRLLHQGQDPNRKLQLPSDQYPCAGLDYREMFDKANAILYVHDLKGRFLALNKAAWKILGNRLVAAHNPSIFHVIPAECRKQVKQRLRQKAKGTSSFVCVVEVLNDDGERLVMEISSRLLHKDGRPYALHGIARDITGNTVGAIESIRDITERRKMEEALRSSEENFRKLAEIAPAMIVVMHGEKVVYVNKSTEKITGFTQAESLNRSPLPCIHPDHREPIIASLSLLKQGGAVSERNLVKLMHKKGSTVWVDLSIAFIDFDGQPCILGVGIDVTENKQAADEIHYLSFHDKLTGLYNRAYLEEILPSYQKSQYMPLSLIMGDLNGLKMTNDAFGHQIGDQLLTRVAWVMQWCCRQKDIIVRWGGDEFLILLPNTDENVVAVIAERIDKSCRNLSGFPIQVSMALGVATQTGIIKDFDVVIKEAEDQMYRTKLLESKSNRSSFIGSLEKTLRVRSHETQAHTERLRKLVVAIARPLQLSADDMHNLTLLAALHDIGKIAIPNSILDKPGPLANDEWEIIKKHPEIGYRIALSLPELAVIAEAILAHHERWDGKGYPMGIKGEQIPLYARILAIADSYDVMISGRPYKKALLEADAIEEIKRCAGSQFDPELVRLFIDLMEKGSAFIRQ